MTGAEQDAAVRHWIETHIGPVTHLARQERWRPAWFAQAERDGAAIPLYVRGDREHMPGNATLPVAKEAAILRVLGEHGIRVPRIHGIVPETGAAVMDRLHGRANLATAVDDAERASVMDDYIDALVMVHAIPPERLAALDLPVPDGAEAIALADFERYVTRFRAGKRRPEPLLEFAIGWLRRNAPRHRGRAVFVLGDPGQFMFEKGRVTGLLDVELAHFGDPAHDLAGLRLRAIPEPLGDLGRAFRRYAQATGAPLDIAAIDYHTAKFALCTPLSLTGTIHSAPAVPELVQYLEWFLQYQLSAIETIAAIEGVTVEEPDLPDPVEPAYAPILGALPAIVGGLASAPGVETFRRDMAVTVARFVHRVACYGPGIDRADMAEQAVLTGVAAATRHEADVALERLAAEAGPDQDAAMIRLFFRRIMRQMKLIEPLLNRTARIERLVPLAALLDAA